jgi:nitrogenase iron protein
MKQIAIYGKGGIGKSTVASNLSASLSLLGKKVLQIGCDPKHDSTRFLMHGKKITTVLDYIKVTNPLDYKIGDILYTGFGNTGCVEAGGPTPGVGCAGRGIITAFELLDNFNIRSKYDLVLYDVLGDVVCGGFAVPIRNEYADTVFIVTSGEFMSLYAANNILRGVSNFDTTAPKVAGIIFNRRNVDNEDAGVIRFANAVGLPICAEIPRSSEFDTAEKAGMTLIEKNRHSEIGSIFKKLAGEIVSGCKLYKANPLTDEALESAILGKVKTTYAPTPAQTETTSEPKAKFNWDPTDVTSPNRYLSKNIINDEPLHGCAFNGAASMSVHIRDAVIVAHSPKSCAYLAYQSISSAGRRGLFERGALLPVSLSPNFECTNMKEAEMIFGGTEVLIDKVKKVKLKRPKAIIVISSCPSGIIGDDIDKIKYLEEDNMPIITIKTDGNISGDYLQGMLMSYTVLAEKIIKKGVKTIANTVNVVFEKVVAKNTNSNFKIIEGFLNAMGVKVNCRFLCETTYEKLENFLSAPLNLLAYDDYTGKILKNYFIDKYGCKFLNEPFPVGFEETKKWLESVGNFFGKKDEAEKIIQDNEKIYAKEIKMLRPYLEGKKLMIITYNHSLDWILKTALDIGMEIVKLGILNFSQDAGFRTNLGISLNMEENYDREKRTHDIKKYGPDILLTNYESSAGSTDYISDTIPMCPDVGFYSGIHMAKRWAKLIKLNLQGEWKNDELLFRKYCP